MADLSPLQVPRDYMPPISACCLTAPHILLYIILGMNADCVKMVLFGPVGAKPGTLVLRLHNRINNVQIELTKRQFDELLINWFLMRQIDNHQKIATALEQSNNIASRPFFEPRGWLPVTYSVYKITEGDLPPEILLLDERLDESPVEVSLPTYFAHLLPK